jgi:hypothetical protein
MRLNDLLALPSELSLFIAACASFACINAPAYKEYAEDYLPAHHRAGIIYIDYKKFPHLPVYR